MLSAHCPIYCANVIGLKCVWWLIYCHAMLQWADKTIWETFCHNLSEVYDNLWCIISRYITILRSIMHNCCAQLLCTTALHNCCAQLLCTTALHNCCAQLLCTTAVHNCCAQLMCTTAVYNCYTQLSVVPPSRDSVIKEFNFLISR